MTARAVLIRRACVQCLLSYAGSATHLRAAQSSATLIEQQAEQCHKDIQKTEAKIQSEAADAQKDEDVRAGAALRRFVGYCAAGLAEQVVTSKAAMYGTRRVRVQAIKALKSQLKQKEAELDQVTSKLAETSQSLAKRLESINQYRRASNDLRAKLTQNEAMQKVRWHGDVLRLHSRWHMRPACTAAARIATHHAVYSLCTERAYEGAEEVDCGRELCQAPLRHIALLVLSCVHAVRWNVSICEL